MIGIDLAEEKNINLKLNITKQIKIKKESVDKIYILSLFLSPLSNKFSKSCLKCLEQMFVFVIIYNKEIYRWVYVKVVKN